MTDNASTLVIAEAGVNHNGSLDLALKLVDVAAAAGANVVKFQTFSADSLASRNLDKADYQKNNCVELESQYEMLKRLELPLDFYDPLLNRCRKKNIGFMSSVFDYQDVPFLSSLGMDYFKIPSGEITNGPLLFDVAKTTSNIILSTGMACLGEIEQALMVLAFGYMYPNTIPNSELIQQNWSSGEAHKVISEKVLVLHCTSDYPAPIESVNLRAMDTIAQAFGVRVGYSDHTESEVVSIAAVARGARVIEKHFTLDKKLPGPDHKASLSPEELRSMVRSIRQVERALGSSVKHRTLVEEKTVHLVRKTIIARQDIKKGNAYSLENLTTQRAGQGMSPMKIWDLLERSAPTSFKKGEKIAY
ncbi:N-acetylneuraminate synthase [bacterium]|nr:N-acetylneuraminate synthase [bacterium]